MDHVKGAASGEKQAGDAIVRNYQPSYSPAREPDLHDSIQRALRPVALALQAAGPDGQPDARSRGALDEVCQLAHRDGLRVEQLLILVKESWRQIPWLHAVFSKDKDATLARVITHCIVEFYRPGRRF